MTRRTYIFATVVFVVTAWFITLATSFPKQAVQLLEMLP